MADMLSIGEAAKRACSEGLQVSEYALRMWVKRGELPHRKAGAKVLIYYPRLVQYLRCEEVNA